MNLNKENFSIVTTETADGKKMVGMFDVDASTPDNKLPISVWIKIPLQQPDQNGLSSNVEAEELNKIEDEIENLIKGRFVGRINFDGVLELYLYAKDAENVKLLLDKFRNESLYKFEFEVEADPEWSIIDSYLKKIN